MLTLTDLQGLGWTFDTDTGVATRADGATARAVTDIGCPLFYLCRAAATIEGDDLPDQTITAALILEVSGETATDQDSATLDTDQAAAEAVAAGNIQAQAADVSRIADQVRTTSLAGTGITVSQLETELQDLLGELQAAIPFFEELALDPSESSEQWTAFQELYEGDVTQFVRLVYDLTRTVAALLRYQAAAIEPPS